MIMIITKLQRALSAHLKEVEGMSVPAKGFEVHMLPSSYGRCLAVAIGNGERSYTMGYVTKELGCTSPEQLYLGILQVLKNKKRLELV